MLGSTATHMALKDASVRTPRSQRVRGTQNRDLAYNKLIVDYREQTPWTPQFLASLHSAAISASAYVPDVGDLAKSAISETIITIFTERSRSRTIREIQAEVGRHADTLTSLATEVEAMKAHGGWDQRTADRESGDPGFSQFVADALEASAETRSDAKRLLLGRFIAHRLQASSDKEAIMLSRTLRTIRDLSEEPLIALACIVLLADLGQPPNVDGRLEQAEQWLAARCGGLFHRIKPRPWTHDDLVTLESVGAITIDRSAATSIFDGGAHAHAVDQWLAQIGVVL